MSHKLVVFATLLVLLPILRVNGELTPPYFNLAEGRKITASATCGVDTDGPELYCKLVGANTEHENPLLKYEVIQGQVCDQCDPSDPDKSHPPEYAIDGTENWWQSPPLSRGMKYNEVNLTIDFGQEFHVAYLYIRMGNSPRPGLWTLEKSSDYGKTWNAWQHFSDSYADCETFFGRDSLKPIQHDNDVICTTEYSKIVPLEGGEIPIRLLNNRPSAGNYFNSITLQEWTRATNVRLRLLRTKNLLGHLMSVARQDPTVTRRYFYSIKDISIGGRCVCNGHASTCGLLDPRSPKKILACQCQHNTCGIQCSECCEGFVQKKWRQNTKENPFQCEPCNCHGHTDKCVYSEEVDEQSLSLDIHGNYEGGGVCKECQDNTEGINCNKCKSTFYRPYGKHWNETDVCHHCNCNYHYSTGNCQEETGRCECREEFQEPNCDACSYGHFGYPDCRPCECNLNGTIGYHCEAINGECPCKINFGGSHCRECAPGYYNFPECEPCDCNSIGSEGNSCHESSGQCQCQPNYSGQHCDQCKNGYYDYPRCTYCHCDSRGTYDEVCNKSNGKCLCREGYGGPRCDQCLPGFYNYPDCVPCNCSSAGSSSTVCDVIGKCTCLENFAGRQCTSCLAGFYNYPECLPCNCDTYGSIGVSCNQEGQCQCKYNFDGVTCNQCKEGFYNFPACEECNCDPAGVIAKFAGCGSVPAGELCQCKERVQGRICDKCRPLYWNLNASNPHGCEDCNCFVDGTVGALDTCDTKSGQCACKPSVTGRTCNVCRDGTFDLYGSNLFGCKDCECDIGGAMNNVCDKTDGNCRCHPRIAGRACDYPLTMHYFPTLYQFQFEYEDGYTSSGAQVRYQFHEDVFPEFSKRGYAVMSELQSEVINEVVILKSSVYRVVIRYKNPNQDNVVANILIQSDNPSEVDQYAKVLFKPTFVPEFVTVSGAKGEIPSPVVLDPGRYTISIKTNKTIFLDYFVLLPAAYYEASILTRKIVNPCEIGDTTLCRHFKYPSIDQYDPIYEAFIENGEDRIKYEDFFPDKEHLNLIGEHNLPFITNSNTKLSYDLDVPHSGRYVIVIDYITYRNSSDSEGEALLLQVNQEGDYEQDGVVTIYPCTYTTVCRQPVVDKESREKVFFVDRNDLKPINLVLDQPGDIAIKSIAAIPYEDWTIDYINPNSVCVMQNGVCVQTAYRVAPESKKIEFEHDNEDRIADKKPKNMYDETTKLVYLDKGSDNLNVKSKIPHSGRYSIIIKFYQPEHPAFNINYRIESDQQNYDGKILLKHCPSNSGCRGLLIQENGIPYFDLDENVDFTLANGHDSRVWFDYVLFVPFDQFSNDLMEEETFDQTKEFIRQCGQDHFHIHLNASDFCKKSVFSLTADYNSGALPCSCDYHGSTSFECESFGGQCQCKPHIIGRQCEACKTGYYGFPDCKPCDCPSTALCHKDTGECICPERVTGEKCDKCMPFTFGFDQIIGCEECNCNPLGVEDNNLQCDLHTGTCDCRSNVVGRACDKCQYGFYNFPDCEPCRCDIRGTTYEICDQEDETCFCKKNTQGKQCNECADGTYNLKDSNPDGCTKCFCFGHTTRCDSAYLRPFNVSMMKDVSLNTINVTNGKMFITPWSVQDDILINETMAIVELSAVDNDELLAGNVYFGMLDFLLNQNSHITAYGGHLSYKIDYSTGFYGEAILAADVILHGKNMNIMHSSTEQPAAGNTFNGHVTIVESNFQTLSGMPVTREQFMIVLRDLQAIFIRANYWNHGVITMISDVSLTLADEDRDHYDLYEELDVERCECPAGYTGYSCEDCAPGYYRDPNGPYGGYCVPCQCNGHADTCDCNTGICENCQHFTTGDHCDQCIEGYYGNATYGTLDDCRICACPLPIESNNFATACEVTEDGYEIHCTCKEGYTGEKCQACAPGFYGDPETEGEVCKPCDCSGNINPVEFGSCDSRSGECLKCLNNTFGTACNLCAPGYYGDAILLKDCKNCVCDPIGTEHCDSFIGTCNCYPNVIGEKCDRCEDDHFGFESGQGCTACECGAASNSTQCEDTTGKCACKPGVTGRQCDRCIQGYWNYGPEGCVPCSCNTDYSRGLGCNAVTGQCECLSGVVGEKCDSCPYRWVLIPDEGCFECDGCHHALLDSTDALKAEIEPILADMKNIAEDYYTSQKLKYFDDLADELEPKVRKLDPNHVNLSPIKHEIEALEMDLKNMDRKLSFAEQNAKDMHTSGDKLLREASDILDNCRLVNKNMKNSVDEVEKLAHNIGKEAETKTEHALTEAVLLFDNIKKYSVTPESLNEQIANATSLLGDMENFLEPVKEQEVRLNEFKFAIGKFDVKLEDLYNWSNDILGKGIDINLMNVKNKGSLNKKFDMVTAQVNEATQNIEDSKKHLDEADNFISDYNSNAAELKKINNTLGLLNDQVEMQLQINDLQMKDIHQNVGMVQNFANDLQMMSNMLSTHYSNVQEITEEPLKAATAYSKIFEEVGAAGDQIQTTIQLAEDANKLTEGIQDRAGMSDQESRELLDEAMKLLNRIQTDLEPRIEKTSATVSKIKTTNDASDDQLNAINDGLQSIPNESYTDTWETAKDKAEDAIEKCKAAKNTMHPIVEQLKYDTQKARQLPQDIDTTNKDILQTSAQIDKFKNLIPNINKMVDSIGEKRDKVDSVLSDLGDRIGGLRKQLEHARDVANAIKVGLTFYPNTSLELKPPESMNQLGASSRVSTYFKTSNPDGLLVYLGNEYNEDKLGKNDFMALEIENGYPVLSVDLGNGPERVINEKYVADDKWYQAIVDRVDNKVKLTIREQGDDNKDMFYEKEANLTGVFSTFDVDNKNSHLFVGSYPVDYKMQSDVKANSYEGQIEELRIGDEQVGLWNFLDAENNYIGADERDRLITHQRSSTGYRFSGNGYVVLDARSYPFKKRSSIEFNFKANRDTSNGLLFYAGKNHHFVSVEMRDGAIVFQFKLGEHAQVVTIGSEGVFNDDRWHHVIAERDRNRGQLSVDGKKLFNEESIATPSSAIEQAEIMYFGGFPSKIQHSDVTTAHFDGCIINVTISGTHVDLSKNLKAFDVKPGCPDKVSSVLSFEPNKFGYLRQPNVSTLNNNLRLNLKFRTKQHKGVIFYATTHNQANTFGLTLEDGILVLRSNKEELTSENSRYDDGEWHSVVATHEPDRLTLTIDDIDYFTSTSSPPPLNIQTGEIYIGGLPKNFVTPRGAISNAAYFTGCISDVSVNSQLSNFAEITDKTNAILDQCSEDLMSYDVVDIPLHYPDGTSEVISKRPVSDIENEIEEEKLDKKKQDRVEKPVDIDVRNEFEEEKTEEPITITTTTTTTTTTEATTTTTTTEATTTTTTELPTTTTTKRPRVTEKPEPICKLPIIPDQEMSFDEGYRFGTGQESRIEFNTAMKMKKQYEFSMQFKTSKPEGLLFYVDDNRHTDYIAIYLKDGKVYHLFNCGSGNANMSSNERYDDGEWHTIQFTRQNNKGRLIVDDMDETEAESMGNTRNMIVQSPLYIGGIMPEHIEDVAINLKFNKDRWEEESFVGCIRNIKKDNADIGQPANIVKVIPCSSDVEPGVYFGKDAGFIKLRDKFKVGNDLTISMDIKPRSLTGMLLSVHGKKAFFILQMINGTIHLSVDNGDGPYSAKYVPDSNENFCDGQWRTITVIKSKYVITIKVNDITSEPAIGEASNSSTDTSRPLFLGGHPHILKIRGLTARKPFQGCIKNVKIRDTLEEITPKMTVGNVLTGVCPSS